MRYLENPYFDIQAEMGMTKHPGGKKTTTELIKLCHITKDSFILDVGCGVGRTACYLAKKIGCKIVGIDISRRMIERAKERAKRLGLKIDFIIADAQHLPFKAYHFDALISESVTSFMFDKKKALSEYYRVTKQGGYIGLNETTWLKKPPLDYNDYAYESIGGDMPQSPDEWKKLLEDTGMTLVHMHAERMRWFFQFLSDIRIISFSDIFRVGYRFIRFYLHDKTFRRELKKMIRDSTNIPKGFLRYFGYGVYVGRRES